MTVKLQVLQDNLQEALRAIDRLTKKEVLVGVTDSTNQRQDSEFGNAGIAYEAEYGSPACNIPMRPIYGPGLRRASPDIAKVLSVAAKLAIEGDPTAVDDGLEVVGHLARDAVQLVITEGNFAPLAQSTIAARARRGNQGAITLLKMQKGKLKPGYWFLAATTYKKYGGGKTMINYLAPPLLDTGAFRQAQTYIVRERKRGRS